MTEDHEIKALLGRAFGPEPPLALDRAEILRRGRRRVRNRWFAASGGVAASVVAVVVGAVAMTGLVGTHSGDRPASGIAAEYTAQPGVTSSGESAPAGPRLPLTTDATPPSAAAAPTTERHAAELTALLAKARPVPAEVKAVPVVDNSEPLVFLAYPGSYLTSADLVDAKGRGSLTVQLTYTTEGKGRGCTERQPWETSCAEVAESGVAMVISTEQQDSGYIAYVVRAFRADGTSVYVNTTNAPIRASKAARPTPPLDPTVLRAIATLPGLTFF
jgi:hypothetical protein